MLSVALCTYNGSKYLREQLESILTQSLSVDELIICDDCSKDDTVSIIKQIVSNYPSIIELFENESSLGPIKNFEKAIGLCKGDIVFLSDQDDIWKQQKVEQVIKKFNESPHLEAVFSDGDMIDENDNLSGKTLWETLTFNQELKKHWSSGQALIEMIYSRNKITGATLSIKKSLYERACPFPVLPTIWHDSWLGIHAAAAGTLGWIAEPLIEYRIHPSQQVGMGKGVTLSGKIEKKNLNIDLLNEKGYYTNCFLIIDKLGNQYPNLDKKLIKNEAVQKLNWVNFRLSLPKRLPIRFFKIVKSHHLYNCNTFFPWKRMVKDFLAIA